VTDNDVQNHTFNASFLGNQSLFNVSSNGEVDFTPNSSQVGNYTVNFSVTDNSICPNDEDWELFNLSIANINDPPVLVEKIPDVEFAEDETVRPFFLDNHFDDPDIGDTLSYNVSGVNEASVTITSESEVIINSDQCDFTDVVIFTAIDPENLTADSNEVQIECVAEQEQQSASSGGGGGGGGGGLCRPDFQCREYKPCSPNGTKVNRCVDTNGCEEEEFITVECNYEQEREEVCREDWECSEWGPCYINETQYRSCEDRNACGTIERKPDEVRQCDYTPTCDDDVMNGNETGIDCGGSCEPCQQVESPTPIQEDQEGWTGMLLWTVLALLVLSLVYRYEHKRVYVLLSRLGLQFAGRVPKTILLSDDERDELLADLEELEASMANQDFVETKEEFFRLVEQFYFYALHVDIEEGRDVVEDALDDVPNQLGSVLDSFLDATLDLEFSASLPDGYALLALIEELRELVLQTADVTPTLLSSSVTEYRIPDNAYGMERVHLKVVNTYIALHYNNLRAAGELYEEVIEEYESLSEEGKDVVYDDINRLYQKLRYRSAWLENL
jgi:hypothetical protein